MIRPIEYHLFLWGIQEQYQNIWHYKTWTANISKKYRRSNARKKLDKDICRMHQTNGYITLIDIGTRSFFRLKIIKCTM